MKLYEVIERIEFNIASNDDISGKGVNTIFSKKNIVYALQTALDHYSQYTLGIEGIKSYSVSTTQRSVNAPQDAVRTNTYRGFFAIISNLKYLLKPEEFIAINNQYYGNNFSGFPTNVYFWENYINIFPLFNESFSATTLAAPITSESTDITLVSTNGFLEYEGRCQIGTETIAYEKIDIPNNTLLNCRRGVEGTNPQNHVIASPVESKNFYVYYYKNHWKIPLLNNTTIDPSYLQKEMEISDDHIEGVIDEASYKLLSKVDIERAAFYKRDYKEFLDDCKYSLVKGRDNTNTYKTTRHIYPFESTTYSRNF
tara:strand:+ start:2559 stop:3494 length:936 start_codon:yes stop_codon:yes gene_type:complete